MSGLRSEDTDEATLLSVLNNNLTKQKHVQKTAQQMSVVPFMIPTLPPQGVFGRASDIRRIEEMLLLNEENVYAVMPVALRGMGGIGKTTLVTAFAHLPAIQSQFPDGVLWVALGPTPLIRGLLDLWGQALDIELRYEPHEEACYKKLRSAVFHRRMLIIIDDVWDAKHAMHFNIAGPYSRTLLTTRELPVAYELATRERTLRVDLLSPKDALDLLRHLSPETVATDVENAQRLCARLEYLPLALTLAGRLLAYEAEVPSRMQRMVDELIERRAARLHLLQSEGRLGLQTEEVSLQANLGLSVERLSRTDQELFAMLSVFGGDPLTCEIQAIAHVWQCSLLEAEAAISRLIQRGLVERRNDRYWMHALLADYAAEMREEMKL